jgi:hypothetical protein
MREMAGGASFGLHNSVLVDERSSRFSVALGANRIHLRRRSQIFLIECAMRIVAVGTLDEPFLDFVMEGHIELRLGVGMALEAELRLRDFEQLIFILSRVNIVAADTAYICFAVGGAVKVCVLALMTSKAPGIHFLGGRLRRIEDFGDISSAIDVSLAWTVTAFACHSGLAVRLSQSGVRVRAEPLGNLFMTGRAGFLSDELFGRSSGLNRSRGGGRSSLA